MWTALLLVAASHAKAPTGLSAADVELIRKTHAAAEAMVSPTVDWNAWAAAHYEPNAVLLPPGVGPVEGRAAIARYLASFGPITHFDTTDLEVDGSGDVAYIRGVYDMTFVPSGGTATRDVGKYIEVWKRQADGSWRCHLDTFSSDAAQ